MQNKEKFLDYTLLDSGEGKKLEKFGDYTLIRPCSQAIWSKQKKKLWQKADAEYRPKKWFLNRKLPDAWPIRINERLQINIRLQNNGQVGLFPEHFNYLPELKDFLQQFKIKTRKAPNVLNLFAYTGLATLYCRDLGCNVTHVELSKRCLDWANENFELNKFDDIRTFKSDVLDFIHRDARKNLQHDLIIIDPPNFSRISKNKTWSLEEILPQLVKTLSQIVNPQNFAVLFSEHAHQSTSNTIANLFQDRFKQKLTLHSADLIVPEMSSSRSVYFGRYTLIKSS